MAAVLWRGVQSFSPVPRVPDRVQALAGSCVVIPCSFTPSRAPWGRRERVDVRMRFKGGGHVFSLTSTAFNSQDRNLVSRDFLGRASLVGRTADGDCSLQVERVTPDDAHVFEVALKRGGEVLWGKPDSFTLDVAETPSAPIISGALAAAEGQTVDLNCSVGFHCPSAPPALSWSWERGARPNGTRAGEVVTLGAGPQGLVLVAPLSFVASHRVKPRLRCEVTYPGAAPLATRRELHVTFPPKEVRVQVQTVSVHEGGSALLACSCKADPPVSEYHWSYTQHGRTVHLHQHGHTVRVYNVTRDMRVRCSARNPIGRGESRSTPLNIQYKPDILRLSSACQFQGQDVWCRCSVDSNPRAAVTWSVNGSAPPPHYNVSAGGAEPHALTSTLSGRMDTPLPVVCFAFNALGNDSLVLLRAEDAPTPMWLLVVIPAVSICSLLLLVLSVLACCCCCCCCHRRRRDAGGNGVPGRRPAVCPEGLGIYQDRTPLYINCTEVTHVYTNGSYQLVYQNCTPLFVRTNQIRPMARRGGERRRGEEGGRGVGGGVGGGGGGACMDRRRAREVREVQGSTPEEADTAIYLEIL